MTDAQLMKSTRKALGSLAHNDGAMGWFCFSQNLLISRVTCWCG